MSLAEFHKPWPRYSSIDFSKLRKSEQTRQKILNAALELLWTTPFRDLTVSGITTKAGVSRTSLYQHFNDLHNLMEELLRNLELEIVEAAKPWFTAKTDVTAKLCESLHEVVTVCYHYGPILRAIFEAAPMDERLEKAWNGFIQVFDDAVTDRIVQDQRDGLAQSFEARPVAVALNRMDIGFLIHHFGSNPRSDIQPVYESIARIWLNTIYGRESPPLIQEQPNYKKPLN